MNVRHLFTIYYSASRNLIYFPHFLAHAVLTVDTGSATILCRWNAATTSSQQVILQTLDENNFGVRRGKWREIKKVLSAIRKWVFSPSTGLQESKDKLQKHWRYGEQHSPNSVSSLNIEKKVPRKIKSSPVQSSELRYTQKDAICPRPPT